ncbi:hypothetical protein RYA05_04830 [Pseudomonas syringae pv. actinidiae]|nr:hypothetical protein [Pseudomonas syringae pv. actinidiae]
MHSHIEQALTSLEIIIPDLESHDLRDSANLAVGAARSLSETLRAIELGAFDQEVDSSQVFAFLKGSSSPLHNALAIIFKNTFPEGIAENFPNLEPKGIDAAVKMINSLRIDTTKFDADTKTVINDCNDDLILSLMDI